MQEDVFVESNDPLHSIQYMYWDVTIHVTRLEVVLYFSHNNELSEINMCWHPKIK